MPPTARRARSRAVIDRDASGIIEAAATKSPGAWTPRLKCDTPFTSGAERVDQAAGAALTVVSDHRSDGGHGGSVRLQPDGHRIEGGGREEGQGGLGCS